MNNKITEKEIIMEAYKLIKKELNKSFCFQINNDFQVTKIIIKKDILNPMNAKIVFVDTNEGRKLRVLYSYNNHCFKAEDFKNFKIIERKLEFLSDNSETLWRDSCSIRQNMEFIRANF